MSITSFNCSTGKVTYSVTNSGGQIFDPSIVNVAFYNGDPRTNAAQFLVSQTSSEPPFPAGATRSHYSITYPSFIGLQNIYAVVNLNTDDGNAIPPLPADLADLTPRLLRPGESNATNNFSNGYTGTGCTNAVIEVTNKGSIGCNNIASYQVQVCNTGNAGADIQNLAPLTPAGFNLLSVRL
jgi:hypothetical protein